MAKSKLLGQILAILSFNSSCRTLSNSSRIKKEHYQLLVAGGGTAGTAMSSKFARKLGKGKVALIEPKEEAVFELLDQDERPTGTTSFTYDLIHIVPPCLPVKEVSGNKQLTNDEGWVTVNKNTMQHTRFPNIFALGDCCDVPTSKTGAAVSSQGGVVRKNIQAVMRGNPLSSSYDGYTSCPVVTSSKTCILAEFDYTLEPRETFPLIREQTHGSHETLLHASPLFVGILTWLVGRTENDSKNSAFGNDKVIMQVCGSGELLYFSDS